MGSNEQASGISRLCRALLQVKVVNAIASSEFVKDENKQRRSSACRAAATDCRKTSEDQQQRRPEAANVDGCMYRIIIIISSFKYITQSSLLALSMCSFVRGGRERDGDSDFDM